MSIFSGSSFEPVVSEFLETPARDLKLIATSLKRIEEPGNERVQFIFLIEEGEHKGKMVCSYVPFTETLRWIAHRLYVAIGRYHTEDFVNPDGSTQRKQIIDPDVEPEDVLGQPIMADLVLDKNGYLSLRNYRSIEPVK